MFEQILAENTARTRRPLTVALSFFGQVLFVGLAVLLPVLHTEGIVTSRLLRVITAPRPQGPKPFIHRGTTDALVRSSGTRRPVFLVPVLQEPPRIPDKILMGDTTPPAGLSLASGPLLSGDTEGVPDGMGAGIVEVPRIAAPKPVAQTPKPVARAPVRVGGVVQAAKLIHQVTPIYPPLARQARISGVVRLEAIIDRTGVIQSLQVMSGHPLLVKAALEAVRQWVYRPTLLNGEPVEVLTQIEVHFKLGE